MPRHKVTLPPAAWPEDLRDRFERHPLSAAQRTRLGLALGRWLKVSTELNVDACDVSRNAWLERTDGMPHDIRNQVRQALAIVFPQATASLYAGDAACAERVDARAQLRAAIVRKLARFPDDWRQSAAPLLHMDEAGFDDGILVQAWAPSTIERLLQVAARHFDYCRARGFAIDITPSSVRSMLREAQSRVESGERRVGGVAIELDALTGLASAVRPDRSWAWLKTSRDRLKKLSQHRGSRNASRAVDAAELRAAGLQLLDKADADHAAARNKRYLIKAHTRARTALTMILLAEAPVRITSCAAVELVGNLLDDLSGLFIDATSTKEGISDRRAFSVTLVNAIGRYVRLHRAVIAAPGETRLFLGDKGRPIAGTQLSKCLGDITEPVFQVRVTPHAIRHSVGNFIVASAPEEAALASIILNHRSDAVTADYHQRADQIIASRRLAAATAHGAAGLSVDTKPISGPGKKPKGRNRQRRTQGLMRGRSRSIQAP